MPYDSISELPDSVKNNLPNDKPEERRGRASREETAHKAAWAAVKQKYEKRGDRWALKRKAA